MHKTTVIGNLGSDPEMRYTPNGVAVTSFSLASNRKYKTSDGESREEVTWFRITAWNKLAEICNQWLTKGKQVYVEGRIKINTYENNSGEFRASLELTANEIQFLGGGQGDNQSGGQRQENQGGGNRQQGSGNRQSNQSGNRNQGNQQNQQQADDEPDGDGWDIDDLPF